MAGVLFALLLLLPCEVLIFRTSSISATEHSVYSEVARCHGCSRPAENCSQVSEERHCCHDNRVSSTSARRCHARAESGTTAEGRLEDPQLICHGCEGVCSHEDTVSCRVSAGRIACTEDACSNPTSCKARCEDKSSMDEQSSSGTPVLETGSWSSNRDAAQEESTSSVSVMTGCVSVAMCVQVALGVIVTVAIYLVLFRGRNPHRTDVSGKPQANKDIFSDQSTLGEDPCKQEAEPLDPPVRRTCASGSVPPGQAEARQELSPSIFLNDVIDDDPGAYMRSLHCDEIARIFRNAVTPMLESHVLQGSLSEEASAELLERHVTETRHLADDWMGRWQRGVSDTLTLSDVWVTLLGMRKAALLQEVQGQRAKFEDGA